MKPYYEKDGITIYHGDCRDVLNSLPLTARFDLVLTDPPYGMNKDSWDVLIPPSEWLGVCRAIAPVMLFCGVKGLFDYPAPDWTLAWMRLGSVQRNGALRGFNNWEPILAYGLPALENDVVSCPNYPDPESTGHPTPKPLTLMRHILNRVHYADHILDPFMGSGTTLLAAKQLGRQAVGIELEERYCEIAARRLDQKVFAFPKDDAPKERQAEMFAETPA